MNFSTTISPSDRNRIESNGRIQTLYILVDDLEKEEAFGVYEEFGFEDREFVWEHIGGNKGDFKFKKFREKEVREYSVTIRWRGLFDHSADFLRE